MVVSNHLPSRDVSDPSALRAAFDTLPLSIVVLDATGVIVVANWAWREFGQRNGLRLEDSGVGTSYLQVCDTARGEGADDARAVGAAIRDALAASTVEHVLEYTCHSPVEQRWYLVRIQGTDVDGERRATVVHRDVTDRRKIEKARQMAARRELEALVDARTRELRVANEELHQAQARVRRDFARRRTRRLISSSRWISVATSCDGSGTWMGCSATRRVSSRGRTAVSCRLTIRTTWNGSGRRCRGRLTRARRSAANVVSRARTGHTGTGRAGAV